MAAPPLIYDEGVDLWRTTARYEKNLGCMTMVVPRGFILDLASIPRFLWPLMAPFELGCEAALVHDALYRHAGYGFLTRVEADRVFLQMMGECGVPWWRRYPAYLAVRVFGKKAWTPQKWRAIDPAHS